MVKNDVYEIRVTVLLSNGTSVLGNYNFECHQFEFSKTIVFEDSFYQSLKLVNINEEVAIISYMFSSDYIPTKFKLSEKNPVEIIDYISSIEPKLDNVRVKIIIELVSLRIGGSNSNERKRDFS